VHDPVELEIRQDHPFRKKSDDPLTGQRRIGCAVCGAGKLRRQHLGAPPSMNDGGSGMDRNAYQALKKAWQAAFTDALRGSGLPLGLEAVTVEGLVGFPTRTGRDQGNHRWMVEKALGDALAEGGWIPEDTFYPVSRYEFGGLQAVHTPGESWLRLMVMPRAAEDRTMALTLPVAAL